MTLAFTVSWVVALLQNKNYRVGACLSIRVGAQLLHFQPWATYPTNTRLLFHHLTKESISCWIRDSSAVKSFYNEFLLWKDPPDNKVLAPGIVFSSRVATSSQSDLRSILAGCCSPLCCSLLSYLDKPRYFDAISRLERHLNIINENHVFLELHWGACFILCDSRSELIKIL